MILWTKWPPNSGRKHNFSSLGHSGRMSVDSCLGLVGAGPYWNPHRRIPCAQSLSLLWVSGSRAHCMDRTGGGGACLEVSSSFTLGAWRTEFPHGNGGAKAACSSGWTSVACGACRERCRQRDRVRAVAGGLSTHCKEQILSCVNFLMGKQVGGQRKVCHEGDVCFSFV